MQDSLLKASAKELLRTDLLHMISEKQNAHKENPWFLRSCSLSHRFTANSFAHVLAWSYESYRRIKFPIYTPRPNSRFTLLDLITGKEKDYHVSDMKPFVFDSAITNPIDVAQRDRMEFFVESIIGHRGNLSRTKEVEFLVHWLNYDNSNDSWEPYANLHDNQHLHVYLLEKKLQRLIPKKFR